MRMYTTKEVADALNVKPRTIQRYAKLEKDALPVAGLANIRGDLRFREDDVIEFAKRHKLTLNLPSDN